MIIYNYKIKIRSSVFEKKTGYNLVQTSDTNPCIEVCNNGNGTGTMYAHKKSNRHVMIIFSVIESREENSIIGEQR
jgi:hypothetical protein